MSAIDSAPLPGQIFFPDHLRGVGGTVTGGSSSPVQHESGGGNPPASLPTFWVRISATHLPQPNGANVDPICLVSLAGISELELHKTEVIPDDADPDFKRALKLDHTKYRAGDRLMFRLFDASELQFEGAAETVTEEELRHIKGGRGTLMCNFVVEIDKLRAIIDKVDAGPTESLIYTQRLDQQKYQEGQLAPTLILSLFPMKHHDMRVLEDDQQYLFHLDDEPDSATEQTILAGCDTCRHDSLLDVIPSHLFAIQSAVACVSVADHQCAMSQSPEEAPPIMSMIDEALQYKNSCLGSGSSVELQHAQNHSDFRFESTCCVYCVHPLICLPNPHPLARTICTHACISRLKNVMKELKQAARDRPEDFYEVNDLGAPVVLYGFVVGSLHNLNEDFGLSVDREAADAAEAGNAGLVDWWDVLSELKQGLLENALENALEQDFRSVYQDADGNSVSSVEAGADAEFQWLLCRPYSNRVLGLEQAWQEVKDGRFKRTVANEYTGENILHILIVKDSQAKYNLAAHLSLLFSKFVTHPRFQMNLMNSKVSSHCPAVASCSS